MGVSYSGSWHDSRAAKASDLVNLVLDNEKIPPEYADFCDSAFGAGTKVTNEKIERARNTYETKKISVLGEMYAIDLILQR